LEFLLNRAEFAIRPFNAKKFPKSTEVQGLYAIAALSILECLLTVAHSKNSGER
jgi:hypothetical protein